MENITPISAFYHPTTAVFVDDSRFFLEIIGIALDPTIALRGFVDPYSAIEFIREHSPKRASSQKLERYENLGNLSFQDKIYNPERFSIPTVMIIDEFMIEIGGLSLCELLQDFSVKKIILTDGFKEESVIEAHKRGLIDYFISRGEANFSQHLNHAILKFQKQYFLQHFSITNKKFSAKNPCLSAPLFIHTFQEICNKYEIVEYYLLEDKHSFALLNEKGNIWWLLTATAAEIDRCCQIAKTKNAPSHVISGLQNHKTLAYVDGLQKITAPNNIEWGQHIFSASRLGKNKPFYYACVETFPYFEFKHKSEIFFGEHLDSMPTSGFTVT